MSARPEAVSPLHPWKKPTTGDTGGDAVLGVTTLEDLGLTGELDPETLTVHSEIPWSDE